MISFYSVSDRGQHPRRKMNSATSKVPVTWLANRISWTTAKVFTDWLITVNTQMKEKQSQGSFFLYDTPSYPVTKDLLDIDLVFSPTNITSKFQPLDQDVIKSFKYLFVKS